MSQFSTQGSSGNIEVQEAGVKKSFRPKINFVSGATVVDDPTNNRANITCAGGGGGGISANLDGGFSIEVYLITQGLDLGDANSVYTPGQILDAGAA